jgi:hypothetical protein
MDCYTNRAIQYSLWWVNGHPKHNHIDGECASDFSCCHPELFTTDQDERMESHKKLLRRLKTDGGY